MRALAREPDAADEEQQPESGQGDMGERGGEVRRADTGQALAAPHSAGVAVILVGLVGECNADNQVTVNELLTLVNIALGTAPLSTCTTGDANGCVD